MSVDPMAEANELNREWCDRMLNEMTASIEHVKALIKSHPGCVPAGLHTARRTISGAPVRHGWSRTAYNWRKWRAIWAPPRT